MNIIKIFKREKWTKYIYMALFVLLFLFKPSFESSIDILKLFIYSSTFLFAVFIHLLSQKNENWFRLDVLFLLGFGIVHFQWAIMMSFSDITPAYLLWGIADIRYVNYGTWLSSIGILAWFTGYAWFFSKKKSIVEYSIKYKKLFWISVILFVLFVMMAGSGFLSGGVYKGQGGGSSGAGISVYFQLFLSISILVLTAVIVLHKKNTFKSKTIVWFLGLDKKYLILAGSYILLFLSVGDRGSAMQLTFTFLVLFGALVRPISLKEFSLIIMAGAIILTLIGLGRSVDTNENILVAGADKVEFTSNYDVTMELANSARTLYSGLSNVPEHHDYFWGKLWLGKILAVIPFSQNVYLQLSGDKSYELGSAGYITFLRYGAKPPSGEGTSLIIDIYLNFGLIGVVFFMFLLGLFFKKVQNELNQQKSYYWIITAALLASLAFYMGRSGLFDMVRPMLWGLVLGTVFVKRKKII